MRAALDADMSTFDTTDAYADITAEVSRGKPSRASAASALSLEVCALARVMKIVRSAHQAIRAWLRNCPPLSQFSPTIGYGNRSATSSLAATKLVWARLRMAMFRGHPR